ncbi:hypothetical protein DLM76_03415 [Leptospira yasudae]|uniref:Uncharacterized protein n=1 Tax=Leptospira yasudae TaxID=2202201 RepID=A0ABX9M7E2_9LEPT|nr:hypothetical protein DLM77_04925 [Leptospira yasudae]RHX96022.1 hypothetical protein DLM76_03415 [Leptospira yasudae]
MSIPRGSESKFPFTSRIDSSSNPASASILINDLRMYRSFVIYQFKLSQKVLCIGANKFFTNSNSL